MTNGRACGRACGGACVCGGGRDKACLVSTTTNRTPDNRLILPIILLSFVNAWKFSI